MVSLSFHPSLPQHQDGRLLPDSKGELFSQRLLTRPVLLSATISEKRGVHTLVISIDFILWHYRVLAKVV